MEQLTLLIKDAFCGFIKSNSIGGPEFTETLQDTFKLLELWFKYGDLPCIEHLIHDNLESIDIVCWLNAIPQIIPILDISDDTLF